MKYAYNFHEVLDKMGFERGFFFLLSPVLEVGSHPFSIQWKICFSMLLQHPRITIIHGKLAFTVIVILLHFFWPIGIYHPLRHARKGILSSTTIKVFHYSTAGKKILIKTVAQAVLMYTMSVVTLPNTLCDEMKNMVHKFWWGQMNERNKMA